MKRILTFFLALTMVLSLAACGGTEQETEETPVEESVTVRVAERPMTIRARQR